MKTTITVEDLYKQKEEFQLVDVRSPMEFEKGHIPGAINIPLFSDRDRAKVGTTYKREGKLSAIKTGADLAGPKISTIIRQFEKIKDKREIVVHCWRGGMRSDSVGWILALSEIPHKILLGGYKSYRRFQLNKYRKSFELLILGGPTGSGKTEVLQVLKNEGFQVINLEKLACHKGSVFGGIGQPIQPSTEQFQNDLFEVFYFFNHAVPIWVENENQIIGSVTLPEIFYNKMINSPLVQLQVDRETRVTRLINDYGALKQNEIEIGIAKIEKRLGNQKMNDAIKFLKDGNLENTAKILLDYYDKAYLKSFKQKQTNCILTVNTKVNDPHKLASLILEGLKAEVD